MSSDISRDDALSILGFLGIHYTPETKLAPETLAEKLTKALDYVQRVVDLVPKRINPSAYASWNKAKPLLEVFRECSLEECAQNMYREQTTGNRNAPLFTDAFMDVRQSLMSIANYYTTTNKSAIFVMEDKEESYSITFRIVNVHALNEDTPLLSLLYDHGPGSAASRAYPFITQHGQIPVPRIISTLLEQKLFIKILDQNSQRISSSFKPKRHASEKAYTRSFLLPLRALTMENIGTLTKAECVLCGVSAASRCSACQAVGYCGKECQTADWKSHKNLCKPLSSGTWQQIRFSFPRVPSGEITLAAPINRNTTASEIMKKDPMRSDAGPPPNVHGTTPFIVKIQAPLGGHGFGMLVYDRQLSFTGCITQNDNPIGYAKLEDAVKRSGVDGVKVYLWAKMIDDWMLDVCLDAKPKDHIQW